MTLHRFCGLDGKMPTGDRKVSTTPKGKYRRDYIDEKGYQDNMSEKKWAKLKGTKVGADGTGYYRGTNGRYYYGNPKNGYVRETYQSVAEREKRAAAQQDRSPDIYDSMFDAVANNLGEVKLRPQDIIISTILSVALITFAAVTFVMYVIFYGTLYSWPHYVRETIQNFARGAFDLPLILMLITLVFMLAYFSFCVHEVLSKRITRTMRYAVVSIIGATVLLAFVRIFSGYIGLAEFLEAVFIAASLSALPSLILCFLGHLVTKEQRGDQRWFITRASKFICPAFIGKSTGMIVFGLLMFLLGLLLSIFYKADAPASAQAVRNTFFVMGVVCSAMGIIDKVKS